MEPPELVGNARKWARIAANSRKPARQDIVIQVVEFVGDPGAIRTRDPQIRNLVLYPAELRDHWAASIQNECREAKRFSRRRGRRLQSLGEALFGETYPVGHAVGDRLVVEVVGGVVEACGLAVPDHDVGARPRLQHEGEILPRH